MVAFEEGVLHRACSSPHRRVPGKFESFSSSLLGQGLPDPEEGACSVSFANVVFEGGKGKPKPSPKDVFSRGWGRNIYPISPVLYAPLFNLLSVVSLRESSRAPSVELFS
jgi:hypothetical protein